MFPYCQQSKRRQGKIFASDARNRRRRHGCPRIGQRGQRLIRRTVLQTDALSEQPLLKAFFNRNGQTETGIEHYIEQYVKHYYDKTLA